MSFFFVFFFSNVMVGINVYNYVYFFLVQKVFLIFFSFKLNFFYNFKLFDINFF